MSDIEQIILLVLILGLSWGLYQWSENGDDSGR